jgi:hypothetical protein
MRWQYISAMPTTRLHGGRPSVARPASTPSLLSAAVRRVDLPLLAIFALGTAFCAYWTLRVDQWGLMTDELLYVKLAQHLGDTLSPVPGVRGEYYGQFTPVYPALLAPLLQIFETPAAYKAAHLLNAMLMASTAIPAYLLTRELGRPRLAAYFVAAISIVVPWVVLSMMLLTESAAYPIFVWTCLAIVRAVASPSPRRDLVAIGAIVLATLTRTQFGVLAVVLVLAALLHELTYQPAWARARPRGRALLHRLREVAVAHRVLVVAAGLALMAAAVLAATGGVARGTGAYGNVLTTELLPHGISRSFRAHLAAVAANVMVVPFVLAVAFGLAAVIRPERKEEHAFAIILGLTVVLLGLESASVNIRTIGGLVQERYTFYIVPLLLVAAACYAHRPRMPLAAMPVAAIVTLWVVAKLDFAIENGYSFVSPFYVELKSIAHDVGSPFGIDDLQPSGLFALVTVATALGMLLLTRVRSTPARVVVVCLPVLIYCGVVTRYDFNRLLPNQDAARAETGLGTPAERERGLNWVDDVLPGGAQAAFAPAVVADLETTRRAWWDLEYWNKSVEKMYALEPAWHDSALPRRQLGLDWGTGALTPRDDVEYLVVPRLDRRFRPAGETVAGTQLLHLVRLEQPWRAAWALRGTDQDGWSAAGKPVLLRLYGTGAGERQARVAVQLTSTPHVPGPRRFRISGAGTSETGVVPSNTTRVARLTTCVDASRRTDLTIRVRGSAILPGDRRVGLAVTGVKVSPGGPCRP